MLLLTVADDFVVLSYMTGVLRGVECAGQAVAYGIKSSDTTDWLSIGLNIGLSTYLNLPALDFHLISVPFSCLLLAIRVDDSPQGTCVHSLFLDCTDFSF